MKNNYDVKLLVQRVFSQIGGIFLLVQVLSTRPTLSHALFSVHITIFTALPVYKSTVRMDDSSHHKKMQQRYATRNLAIIACIVVAEPLASTSLLPFVYFMVKGFGYQESQVGARAGLISMNFSRHGLNPHFHCFLL